MRTFSAAIIAVAVSMMTFGAASVEAQKATPNAAVYGPQSQTLALADQVAIVDIIARMNQAIDANDYQTYAGFYAGDGAIDSGFGPLVVGRAAIVASLNQSAPFITNKRHVATNIVINRTGKTATAVYYLTVFEREAGLSLAGTAMITDEFRRAASGWQVVRHTTRMDAATQRAMSAAMAARPK